MPFAVPLGVINKTIKHGTYHMIGGWVRLPERQDVEDVQIRVEEGGVLGPELSIGRNRPFPISAQQRSEYQCQVERDC